MRTLHHQIKAREDLKKIWRYGYREHGQRQADRYYDQLSAGMKRIEDNPHIGLSCDHIRKGYRLLQINHHYVFYRLTVKKIRIVRVLHERMDFKKHL